MLASGNWSLRQLAPALSLRRNDEDAFGPEQLGGAGVGVGGGGGGGGAPEGRCEWHLRQERSNNMYLLPLFPLEEGGGRSGGDAINERLRDTGASEERERLVICLGI